ncbi:hypothetical protein [Chryseosolibacter indicus]|uniref:Uncharacterized protein n=1 Tax=Chryseosolibacter indicus TaxID=2782351 RepID=A0ABS5VU58_9BACT|nr:hypothetical protein [Chryseosolibacter indicus]MBT1704871.1 hypothetical protein [Chryseosolibacter indicus]
MIATGSSTDSANTEQVRLEYDNLSRKINKFCQWVETNFEVNRKKKPATGNWQQVTEDDDIKDYTV